MNPRGRVRLSRARSAKSPVESVAALTGSIALAYTPRELL
jgi:hypothetical protein